MIFRPRNSLILAYDHLTEESTREMFEQIDEVRQYYSAGTIEETVRNLKKGKVRGTYSVLFKNPRKSVFLRAVPELLSREIPFAVAVRGDCVGTNRLPPEEELDLYAEEYPQEKALFSSCKQKIWTDPLGVETFLDECRKKIGPLPIEKADPTRFFVTWGKILDVPSKYREIALGIWFSPACKESFEREKQFLETQIRQPLKVGFAHQIDTYIISSRLDGLVTEKTGAIEKTTSPFDLPQWKFNSSADKI